MLTHAHGIGAGLYQCNDATTSGARAQPLQSRRNSRRVMSKIIVQRHIAGPTQQFQSAFDTLEFFEGCHCHIRCNTGMSRRHERGKRIFNIVTATV